MKSEQEIRVKINKAKEAFNQCIPDGEVSHEFAGFIQALEWVLGVLI